MTMEISAHVEDVGLALANTIRSCPRKAKRIAQEFAKASSSAIAYRNTDGDWELAFVARFPVPNGHGWYDMNEGVYAALDFLLDLGEPGLITYINLHDAEKALEDVGGEVYVGEVYVG